MPCAGLRIDGVAHGFSRGGLESTAHSRGATFRDVGD